MACNEQRTPTSNIGSLGGALPTEIPCERDARIQMLEQRDRPISMSGQGYNGGGNGGRGKHFAIGSDQRAKENVGEDLMTLTLISYRYGMIVKAQILSIKQNKTGRWGKQIRRGEHYH